jgi:tRNA (cmo5U34)-methyltransferase
MSHKTDNLFSSPREKSAFNFDQQVAEVFPDMITRSVPGYTEIVNTIGHIAQSFIKNDSLVYDLGCSLGAATLSIRQQVTDKSYSIIGIDNSAAMVERCKQHLAVFKSNIDTQIELADILNYPYQPCALIVINFTLQFLAPETRATLLKKLYQQLIPGGALILSEKLAFEDPLISSKFTELHHDYKKRNGYSDLEISQKRAALENVLIPETQKNHIERLKSVGFNHCECWYQHYNFASFLAIK